MQYILPPPFRRKFYIKILTLIALIVFSIKPTICQTLNFNDSISTRVKLNQSVLAGIPDHLFSNKDTLVMYLNLSCCTYRRYDIIRFYKDDGAIYIKPEVRITFDKEEITWGQVKKYKPNRNDSLNLEFLVSKLQHALTEIPDSLGDKSVFMSMGVLHKWGKNYYSDRITEENSRFYNLYLSIMHEIYPEMEEFVPPEFEIIEEE